MLCLCELSYTLLCFARYVGLMCSTTLDMSQICVEITKYDLNDICGECHAL